MKVTLNKFLKMLLVGLALFVITRVGTHLFLSGPRQPGAGSSARPPASPPASPPTAAAAQPGTPRLSPEEFNQGVVAIMNKRYPKMGPGGVRIDRVSYADKRFTFHKTYTEHTADMFDPEELRENRPLLIAELCASTLADMFREGVAEIGNEVRDRNGVLIHAFHASKQDCESVKRGS